MKKVFIMLAAAACSLAAMATDYTGKLTVTINGESLYQEATIQISENEGKFDLDLNNFKMVSPETTIGVGNINIHGLEATNSYGFNNLQYSNNIQIAAGDDPSVDMWMGPMLGDVPIVMSADFNDQMVNFNIDIDMTESLQQVIEVNFVGVAPAGKTGDINGDDIVDLSDVNTVINIVLGK